MDNKSVIQNKINGNGDHHFAISTLAAVERDFGASLEIGASALIATQTSAPSNLDDHGRRMKLRHRNFKFSPLCSKLSFKLEDQQQRQQWWWWW